MKPLKIGLLGLGTVGSGVVQVLQANQEDIKTRIGRALEIKCICVKNLNKSRNLSVNGIKMTDDPQVLIEDADIDVIVEAVGGLGIKPIILQAIAAGKPIVTANKALIALEGNEIFKAARQQGVAVMFEAAVAGGIPIIKALREGLSGNQIEWLAGIINGTSNYILTEMFAKQLSFEIALQQAQSLGYAEADPTFDIEGIDAAHKLAILSAIAFGVPLEFEKVCSEGIHKLQVYDVQVTQQLGYTIKSLAIASRTTDKQGVMLQVAPILVKKDQLMAQVSGVMNALYVMTNSVGPTLFCGAGAGGLPTASAIVADLIDVARTLETPIQQRVPYLGCMPDMAKQPALHVQNTQTLAMSCYLRISAKDQPGTLAVVTEVLAKFQISIEFIAQYAQEKSQGFVPIVIITHPACEKDINSAMETIEAINVIQGPVVRMRIAKFEEAI